MNPKILQARKSIILLIFWTVGLVFISRLFYIQIIDKTYQLSASNNVLRKATIYPSRGNLFDRNGKMLVYNEAAYDLMVIPMQVNELDTAEFCELLQMSKETFLSKLLAAKKYSRFKPSIFESQLSKETYGFFEEKMYKFQGFFVQPRTLRKYPKPIASHILGYIGEVSPQEMEKESYYTMGDYIGKSGVEQFYEPVLRGKKGYRYVLVDVHNREKGSYEDGKYDSASIPGKDLYLTIDGILQEYGEMLMNNKIGSIVALEPGTGEILAMVSSPAYDPNLLIGRVRTKNYSMLYSDSLKPLFNRAIQAEYPPGSSFKLMQAMVALQEGVINVESRFPCGGTDAVPIKCSHNHYSPLALEEAIEQSCNPYFWGVYREFLENRNYKNTSDSYAKWREYALNFNFGRKFDTDILNQRAGNIPSNAYFDRYFGKGRWRPMTIRSLSIGQGEVLLTPLQMANYAAIAANRGYYFDPHVVKAINDPDSTNTRMIHKHLTGVDSVNAEIVVNGMYRVFTAPHGTARYYKNDSIPMCGKTGTVQNPHGKDHSIFIAFAPKDNPKIAISVVVENSGFGATYAAPIAILMMEKYLAGKINKPEVEERMKNMNLIKN